MVLRYYYNYYNIHHELHNYYFLIHDDNGICSVPIYVSQVNKVNKSRTANICVTFAIEIYKRNITFIFVRRDYQFGQNINNVV